MGICSNLSMWIAVAFLTAHIIADVQCAPPKLAPKQIEAIRANILAQIGMTEPPPPLTSDQVKVVKALKEYHAATEAKRSISEKSTTDSSQQRLKRQSGSSGIGPCIPDQVTCCLHPLEINFSEDLGLDIIITPQSYTANYCNGTCSLNASPEVFNFYSQLDSTNPASSIVPCCATSNTSSLEIIFISDIDTGLISVSNLPGATVNTCGCM